MKRLFDRLGWGIAGALGVAIIALAGGIVSAGPLTPPGPPTATQETLIFQPASCADFPIQLNAGSERRSYRFAETIQMPAGCNKDGIDIQTGNVTLDMAGFALEGQGSAGTDQDGIEIGDPGGPIFVGSVVIRNGAVSLFDGIGINGPYTNRTLVEGMNITSNGGGGILVGTSAMIINSHSSSNTGVGISVQAGSLIDGSISNSNTLEGIVVGDFINPNATGGMVINSTASFNGSTGIALTAAGVTLRDSSSTKNSGHGVYIENETVVAGNDIHSNTLDGIHIVGPSNRIEDNQLTKNSARGLNALGAGAVDNTIIRNTADANTIAAFGVAAGNMLGTVVATEAAMNTAANDLINLDVP